MAFFPDFDVLFSAHGEDATLKSFTTTINDYGDKTITSTSSSTITVIPVNIVKSVRNIQEFGDLPDTDIVFYSKTEPQDGNKIEWNNTTWIVKSVSKAGDLYTISCKEEK